MSIGRGGPSRAYARVTPPAAAGWRAWSRIVVILGCLAGFVATGCNDDQTDPKREVTFWTLDLAAKFTPYVTDQIRRFEAANPGVRVKWVDVPYDALDRKLIAAAAAGRAPDVVNMADLNFARYVALGAFRPIGADLPAGAEERYIAGAIGLCRINGELMALPWYVNPQARLVNLALLAEGGLDESSLGRDWRTLLAQAAAFKERTGKFLFSQPLGEESQLPIMMLADGIVPLKETGDGRLAADLRKPEVVEFVSMFVEAYSDGRLPRDAATRGHAHLLELYQEQKLAVINTGPNLLLRIKDVAPAVHRQTRILPGTVGRLGRVHMPIMVLAVMAQSRLPREAAALAWHMTGPEAQTEFCKQVAIMPSSMDSLADPYFLPPVGDQPSERDTEVQARVVAAATVGDAVGFTAALDCWPDLRRAFDEAMKRILIDGVSVQDGLAELETEWNRILASAAPATLDAVPRPPPLRP